MYTFAQYSCVYILEFAEVYTAVYTHSSLKVDKSIVGTSPRYRFMVTMEPGTRQMKFFDTKLQMFENLNFVQKITNSQVETPDPFPGVCRDYKRGYETGEVGCQYWPPEYWCYSLKH